MKVISFIIILTLFVVGCAVHQQSNKESTKKNSTTVASITDTTSISTTSQIIDTQLVEQPYNFEFEIIRYHPYCGGAAPTEDKLNNYSPEVAEFVLINLKTNKKNTFKTDSLGIKKMQLQSGNYGIKEKFKDVSFEKFYKQYKQESNNFTKSQGKECYKQWWESNLVEFEIADTTTILKKKIVVSDACFTGKNPCLNFKGPYPP